MIVGYSVLEGVGSALMIPPIYILVTVAFSDVRTRAKYFGVVSGAAGLGSAAGPLVGGLITSAINWRASFMFQVLVVALIIYLSVRIESPTWEGPRPRFDIVGAVLSAAGLFFIVLGILSTSTYGWFATREDVSVAGTVVIPEGGVAPVWIMLVIGALILLWFFLHVRSTEKAGKEPLLPMRLFRNRTANLGLGTQTVQWLTMQGIFFVVSVFLQENRHYSAIETGLMLTPATVGILLASAAAERLARRRPQRQLIVAGFTASALGLGLMLWLARATSGNITYVPGLFLIGIGVGVMLTASVNVVQSSFPASDQGDISGLSRSVSNLGSSLGVALAGSVLVAASSPGDHPFALAIGTMLAISLVGLVLAVLIPRQPARTPGAPSSVVDEAETA
jgi:MFS family permease